MARTVIFLDEDDASFFQDFAKPAQRQRVGCVTNLYSRDSALADASQRGKIVNAYPQSSASHTQLIAR